MTLAVTDSIEQTTHTNAADSVASLVPLYGTLLFRVAHAALRNRAEAEDVVQETFVRVLQHHHTLQEVRDMRVWLVRIAWNLALDRRRRIRPSQMDDAFAEALASATVPADKALVQSAHLRSVLEEMERLPKAECHVLLLNAVDEMGTAEIAEVLQKSESAVRALLFRARTRLRERVERRWQTRRNA
ncbi:RNA polymerase sigma factor [Terriglobus sp. TAA 43]|uniref:RNA polymerase sigma factor n=1 Tax=Terriglobus sp. TAA 43 TaxID=278961 RepID=UPI001E3420D1|nr:sigma-70 family RNA polymerase sigma factor [Terriglobus sp. TAA 43]